MYFIMEKNLLESKNKTNEDLDELLLAFIDCKDEKKKRMLHLNIVECEMQLVKKIASNISAQSGISNEDLIQVGSIGLIKAIEFFNPEKTPDLKHMPHILSEEKSSTIYEIKLQSLKLRENYKNLFSK